MESHGAALKAIQAAYGPQGLFLCGLVRQEHPYDVEDYVRHFRVRFPVYKNLKDLTLRTGVIMVTLLSMWMPVVLFSPKAIFIIGVLLQPTIVMTL